MPLAPPPVVETVRCSMAPADVSSFLYSHGWQLNSSDNSWFKYGDGVEGDNFDWPEALAYEMFLKLRPMVLLAPEQE